MKLSWSTLKVGGIGVVALTLSLVGQQTVGAQHHTQPHTGVRPVATHYTPQNRTLSNYYPYAAVPGNPLSSTNRLNNNINQYYQNQANRQLNTVTGIIGTNLSPLVQGNNGYGSYGYPTNLGSLYGSYPYGSSYGSPYGNPYGGFNQGGYGTPYGGGTTGFPALNGRGVGQIGGFQGTMQNYFGGTGYGSFGSGYGGAYGSPFASPYGSFGSGYSSPFSGFGSGYNSSFLSPYGGVGSGYGSPFSGVGSGYSNPLSGVGSGYSSPFGGVGSGYGGGRVNGFGSPFTGGGF